MPHRLFIPKNNKRSPVLSILGLLIANLGLLTLILLRTFSIGNTQIKILGFATDINVNELFRQTNQARIKNGLEPLSYNTTLAKAAEKKAKDMFEDNYWAHIAPDGTTPWDFIKGEGYRYTYAGENLAKDFNKSESVVKAWMKSPTHRENLLNPNYTEIGFAVVNGVLKGEKTTLVVQMFGKPVNGVSTLKNSNPKKEKIEQEPTIAVQETQKVYSPTKVLSNQNLKEEESLIQIKVEYALKFAYFLLGFFFIALIIDGIIAFKQRHIRLTGNTLSHLVLFIGTLLFLIYINNPTTL